MGANGGWRKPRSNGGLAYHASSVTTKEAAPCVMHF